MGRGGRLRGKRLGGWKKGEEKCVQPEWERDKENGEAGEGG